MIDATFQPTAESDNLPPYSGEFSVRDYPSPLYRREIVRSAGKVLAKDIPNPIGTPEAEPIAEAFRIAYNWRDAHLFPMDRMRRMISGKMVALGIKGNTAARPKRMASIRKKLFKRGIHLDKIDDLAGCRAILDDMASVKRLAAALREQGRYTLRNEKDYINDLVRIDGYRSAHMMFDYVQDEVGASQHTGLRVEVQIRTRLQHSWATSVEAVGLFKSMDLKGGEGDKDWLRLFSLMSAEFAVAEGTPIHADLQGERARFEEIRDLSQRLDAVKTLENIGSATKYAEDFIHSPGKLYLLRYNPDRTVTVTTYDNPKMGARSLSEMEEGLRQELGDASVVLVEVERVDRLIDAYPNYFGDVRLFTRNLARVCAGEGAIEYSMLPQERVAPPPREAPIDARWMTCKSFGFLHNDGWRKPRK